MGEFLAAGALYFTVLPRHRLWHGSGQRRDPTKLQRRRLISIHPNLWRREPSHRQGLGLSYRNRGHIPRRRKRYIECYGTTTITENVKIIPSGTGRTYLETRLLLNAHLQEIHEGRIGTVVNCQGNPWSYPENYKHRHLFLEVTAPGINLVQRQASLMRKLKQHVALIRKSEETLRRRPHRPANKSSLPPIVSS